MTPKNPPMIVQDNELLHSSYSFTLNEMRLINLALSKVDSQKENPGRFSLYPEDFAQMYGEQSDNPWRMMKLAVDNIMMQPIHIYRPDSKGNKKRYSFHWFTETERFVNPEHGTEIVVEFSKQVTPYLFELQANFTKCNFEYASKLTTPFSFRLYQWMIEHLNKAKGQTGHKKGDVVSFTLTIEEIKDKTRLENAYPVWADFKRKVLEPAIQHINARTNISTEMQPLRRGRAFYAVEFSVVEEAAVLAKPVRPRLKRRPKVKAGTAAEGDWMRANLKLLLEYERQLKEYDPKARLTISDLEKVAQYSAVGDSLTHDRATAELTARRAKPKLKLVKAA